MTTTATTKTAKKKTAKKKTTGKTRPKKTATSGKTARRSTIPTTEQAKRAEHHYDVAVKAYLRGNNNAANTAVRKALKLIPAHRKAAALEERVKIALHPNSQRQADGSIITVSKDGITIYKDAAGHLLPGQNVNPWGGKGNKNRISFNALVEAIHSVESNKKVTLLQHLVRRAFKSDTVLLGTLKKLVPDLKSIEQLIVTEDAMTDQEAEDIRNQIQQRFNRRNTP